MQNFFFDYYIDDDSYARNLLENPLFEKNNPEIEELTRHFVNDMRQNKSIIGSVDDLLLSYGLDTKEGLALMALAEALLRIPDTETASNLIESKLNEINIQNLPADDNIFMRAISWGMGIAQTIVKKEDSPSSLIQKAIKKLGVPCVRNATYQMIKIMSGTFILGQTIEKAIDNAKSNDLYSFDMLGEGARNSKIAGRYYELYKHAISKAAELNKGKEVAQSQSVSIKISALHAKFFPQFREHVFDEVYKIVYSLVYFAFTKNVPVTIDAEEADRLEFTIGIFSKLAQEKSLAGWNGLGIVIQAYQKRATSVIQHVISLAKKNYRNIPIRLVKGAYWDGEVKKAQERGLKDFPVFTRKSLTDLNYLHCAQLLFDNRQYVFPQTATHNALTIAQLIHLAGNGEGWEIQRLHGMGEELYESVAQHCPQISQRIYAPVGQYEDLLSYLVRRLLENGANSSFVNSVAKKEIPVEHFLRFPSDSLSNKYSMRHPDVKKPSEIFTPRLNSHGFELGFAQDFEDLTNAAQKIPNYKKPIISDYSDESSKPHSVLMPANGARLAEIHLSSPETTHKAIDNAQNFFNEWQRTPVVHRAQILINMSDLIEENTPFLLSLLVYEAGKTIIDAEADIREAVDFCRYYADIAMKKFSEATKLPSPNGERNVHFYAPRGVFACISPWNFPIAIFTGQIAAALVCGNTVVAKPAEQTPIVAYEIMNLFYQAGLPKEALSLVFGDAEIGSALTSHSDIAGIAFTGSTQVAQIINRTLANSDEAIRPFIAETGGLNAMIVDSTALLEQVTDDVIMSAFRSAGQRCSALRLLMVQDDIADDLITMLKDTTSEMIIEHPSNIASEMGPIIDAEAKGNIEAYLEENKEYIIHDGRSQVPHHLTGAGYFLGPVMIEVKDLENFNREIFGPVLHIVRYPLVELDNYLEALDKKGYGLTLGVHSRIPEFAQHIAYKMRAGNVYINRNIIGAVVGAQPFGGFGKSGTGPKAGGPDYLTKFCYERVISTNIAAAGGDPELMVIPND